MAMADAFAADENDELVAVVAVSAAVIDVVASVDDEYVADDETVDDEIVADDDVAGDNAAAVDDEGAADGVAIVAVAVVAFAVPFAVHVRRRQQRLAWQLLGDYSDASES